MASNTKDIDFLTLENDRLVGENENLKTQLCIKTSELNTLAKASQKFKETKQKQIELLVNAIIEAKKSEYNVIFDGQKRILIQIGKALRDELTRFNGLADVECTLKLFTEEAKRVADHFISERKRVMMIFKKSSAEMRTKQTVVTMPMPNLLPEPDLLGFYQRLLKIIIDDPGDCINEVNQPQLNGESDVPYIPSSSGESGVTNCYDDANPSASRAPQSEALECNSDRIISTGTMISEKPETQSSHLPSSSAPEQCDDANPSASSAPQSSEALERNSERNVSMSTIISKKSGTQKDKLLRRLKATFPNLKEEEISTFIEEVHSSTSFRGKLMSQITEEIKQHILRSISPGATAPLGSKSSDCGSATIKSRIVNIDERLSESAIDQDTKCTICLDLEKGGLMKIECGHYFHNKCLKGWTEKNSTCPICRSYVLLNGQYPNLTRHLTNSQSLTH